MFFDFRMEKLKIIYAGHGIFKDKYYGVYRCNGEPVMSIEVIALVYHWWQTDVKYVYGRTYDAKEDVEYINAAHVFSDMLALFQESQQRSFKTRNDNTGDIFHSDKSPSSPGEVSSSQSKLIIVIRSQCLTWQDKFILGIPFGNLHFAHRSIWSSTKINESHALPNTKILPFHSQRTKRFHSRIHARIPTNYTK